MYDRMLSYEKNESLIYLNFFFSFQGTTKVCEASKKACEGEKLVF